MVTFISKNEVDEGEGYSYGGTMSIGIVDMLNKVAERVWFCEKYHVSLSNVDRCISGLISESEVLTRRSVRNESDGKSCAQDRYSVERGEKAALIIPFVS